MIKREEGFYWIKRRYKSDPWVIARWKHKCWMEFTYSLPSSFRKVYRVSHRIWEPAT